MYPGNLGNRRADLNLPGSSDETAVRAGIIAGNNLGALAGSRRRKRIAGESRLNGGMHNFPRFLEQMERSLEFRRLANSLVSLDPGGRSVQR